jgi:hypothetical protein
MHSHSFAMFRAILVSSFSTAIAAHRSSSFVHMNQSIGDVLPNFNELIAPGFRHAESQRTGGML